MSQDNLTPIGGIYTSASPAFQRGIYKGSFRCLKAAIHDDGVVLKVKVKEATKQGFSVARGGGMPLISRCREARPEGGESG